MTALRTGVDVPAGADWGGLWRVLQVALVIGVVWFAVDVLARLVQRAVLARAMTRADPTLPNVQPFVREALPLLRWRQTRFRHPPDPFALGTSVVVPPLGDGRPGERFLAAGPSQVQGRLGEDGSRTDATVPLAPGVALLVVCLGRIGVPRPVGEPLGTARERLAGIDTPGPRHRPRVGPVERGVTAAGEAWRHTFAVGANYVTDTHVDYEGWGFVIGVLRPAWFVGAERIADGVLNSWRWVPDGGLPRG